MLNKYSEILSAMQYEHNQLPSEKYLLVDGLNLFIRAFAANPTINADGIHIGGISGSLASLGSAIKQFNPTRVIIVVDGKGGSVRRKKIFPDYKANRKKKKKTYKYNRSYEGYGPDLEKQMMKLQLSRLFEYFEHMPITIIMIDYVEADDIIAHIATTYNNVQHVIMSADKDFLQLCTTDNIKV
ncbi:MAG: hypothetical protein HQ541_04275 [Mariniphaga sp.]|nr:hypothetical protein [Mariniphaga sp.]